MQPAKLYKTDYHIILTRLWTQKLKMNDCPGKFISVPSAVSSMLERLCPRLIPLTAGARSTLDPLSWGVEDVTSGGTLFSGVEKRVKGMNSQTTHLVILEPFISKAYRYACVPVHLPRGKQQVEAGAVVGFLALHGRGWKKQTRK